MIKSLFVKNKRNQNLSITPANLLIGALASHPRCNYRMEFLDDIMMQKYSLFQLAELQEEIDDLVSYLENRSKLVNDIIGRIQWIKPVPSNRTPHGF